MAENMCASPAEVKEEPQEVFNNIVEVLENIHKATNKQTESSNQVDPYSLHKLLLEGKFCEAYTMIKNETDTIDVDLKFTNKFTCFQEVTPLHLAVKSNQLKIFQSLIEIDPLNIDVQDLFGNTPLHIAVDFGHFEILKYLFDYCCEVNAVNHEGQTPLHIAAFKNEVEIVKYLLEHGANFNIRDKYGATPLHYAAYNGCTKIIKLLVEHGANVNSSVPFHYFNSLRYPIHWAASTDTLLQFQKLNHDFTSTPINQNHKIESIKLLLKYSASLNFENQISPLHIAVTSKFDFSNVINFLIENGSNIEGVDRNGSTPLHFATQYGTQTSISILLNAGCNVNCVDKNENTPLHHLCARKEASLQIAELLMSYGANINLKNINGETPIMLAQNTGDPILLRYLVSVSMGDNCNIA